MGGSRSRLMRVLSLPGGPTHLAVRATRNGSNWTDRFAKSATTGGRKSPIFDEVIGFGVQLRKGGCKSFTLDYTFEGRRWRLYIGDVPN